jgi:UDP-galactose-lipooligosaccharide galactosyltransferase
MKIGIITFWDSQDNYGQLLQCFALQHYLKQQGHEPFLIRYVKSKKSEHIFWKLIKAINPSHIKAYLKYKHDLALKSEFNRSHPRNFDNFREKYLSVSDRIYHSYEELWSENWAKVDLFICGSDQIWSPNQDHNVYFLSFVPREVPKIAYAASFGRKVLPSDYAEELNNLLKPFRAVSVRESHGIGFCKDAGYDSVIKVPDPTLLLKASDFRHAFKLEDNIDASGVFCYLINWPTKIPETEIKGLAEDENISLFTTTGIFSHSFAEISKDLSIPAWLKNLSESRCIVTNSFHGTVFSIIFNRPFVVLPLSGDASQMNTRIESLLTELGLSDRIYLGGDLKMQMIKPINWIEVNSKIELLRSVGYDFLNSELEIHAFCKPSHICFITSGEVHHNFGGLDRVTEMLASAFETKGIKVSFLSFKRRMDKHDKRQHFFPESDVADCCENSAYLAQFIKANGIDAVINQEGNVNINVSLEKKIADKIVWLTVLHFAPNYIHDSHFKHKFEGTDLMNIICKSLFSISFIKISALKFLRNKLRKNYLYQAKHCDAFVLLSNCFRKDMAQLLQINDLPCDKFCAINNPANCLQASNIPTKEKIVLYVGRLENSQKRTDFLLNIWKVVGVRHPDWKFIIVGDGPSRDDLQLQVCREVIPNVSFKGLSDPRPYYAKAPLLLFASDKSEGWGMVLVEAQSYGCIPIAFDSYSAIHDIIESGKNGFIIPDSDKYKYIETLESLIRQFPDYGSLPVECINNVKRFDIDTISDEWLRLIDSIKKSKNI